MYGGNLLLPKPLYSQPVRAPLRRCRLAPATPTQTLEPPTSTSTASFLHPLGNNRHARSSSSRPSLTSPIAFLTCFSPACNPPPQPPALHLTIHILQNGRTPPKARHCRRWCLWKNVSVDVSSQLLQLPLLPSLLCRDRAPAAAICLSIAYFIAHRPSTHLPINSLQHPRHLSCPRRADLNPSVFSKGTFPEVRDTPVLPRRSRIRHLPISSCPLSRGRPSGKSQQQQQLLQHQPFPTPVQSSPSASHSRRPTSTALPPAGHHALHHLVSRSACLISNRSTSPPFSRTTSPMSRLMASTSSWHYGILLARKITTVSDRCHTPTPTLS